jgi:hypothetical protein
MLPHATIWQFTTPHGGLDVIHEAPGAREYENLQRDSVVITLGGNRIAVVGLDDLIRMKLARGRRVDLDDVAALTDPGGN